ncbi:MAG TPA: MipA/OmpV family protein [Burkholderiales bacterium]|nr:MipA/OmpV family protein [Burkholderiales bacterium]
MNWRLLAPAALLMLLAVAAAPAPADELPLWEAGLGAYALRLPDYRGSNQSRGYLYPLPYLRYRGKLLRMDDRHGLAALLLLEKRAVELDVSLNASQPAPSDQNDARHGMPDLQPTLEIGPVLRFNLWRNAADTDVLSLQLPVRAAFAFDSLRPHDIGLVFNPVIDWFMRDAGPGGGWRLGLQAGPLFNDRRYNDYYYQVDPQFAEPGRPAYAASGGYGGTQFTASLNKRFRSVWVSAFVRVYDLHGAVFEDSPLVKQSSAVLAGIGFAYVFAESKTRVEAKD